MNDQELRNKLSETLKVMGKKLSPHEQEIFCEGWDAARANDSHKDQLRAEVEQLRGIETSRISSVDRDHQKLKAAAEKLADALEFYGNRLNYECAWRPDLKEYVPANSEGSSEIEQHKWNIAKQALAEYREKFKKEEK